MPSATTATELHDARQPTTADEHARALRDAEGRLGRKLSRAEQNLDIVGIDRDLANGKDRLYAAIEREKRRALKAHFRYGRTVKLNVTDAMMLALRALYRAGQRHARREIQDIAGFDVKPPTAGEKDWLDGMRIQLGQLLHQLERKVNARAGEARGSGLALSEEREMVGLDVGQAAQQIAERRVMQMPGALNVASQLVSQGLYNGVGSVYDEAVGLFDSWEYTAVMDSGTCDPCAELDGSEYASWDEIQQVLPDGGPNPDCDGEGRCRCRAVPGAVSDTVTAPGAELVASDEISATTMPLDYRDPAYDAAYRIAGRPLTRQQERLFNKDWSAPPKPRGINKGRGGAGGYTSSKSESSLTAMGREAEGYFQRLTKGHIIHGRGEQSPLDVLVDGMGFEVKGVNVDATSFKATPKDYERASKEAFAAALGVDPNLAIVLIDRKAGIAKVYWREGLDGGRLSERTGWKYMGEVPVDDTAATALEPGMPDWWQHLPDHARQPAGDLTVEEAQTQLDRLQKYVRPLRGHVKAGTRNVHPDKVPALERRIDELKTRIREGGGDVKPPARPPRAPKQPPVEQLSDREAVLALRGAPNGTTVRVSSWTSHNGYAASGGEATTHNGVMIFSEWGTSPRKVEAIKHHIDMLMQADVSPERVSELERVDILNSGNPMDANYSFKGQPFVSAATGGRNRIVYYNGGLEEASIFNHEFGHVAGVYNGPPDITVWKDAQHWDKQTSAKWRGETVHWYHPPTFGTDAVTEYGGTKIVEDWAESVAMYLDSERQGFLFTFIDKSQRVPKRRGVPFDEVFPARARIIRDWLRDELKTTSADLPRA